MSNSIEDNKPQQPEESNQPDKDSLLANTGILIQLAREKVLCPAALEESLRITQVIPDRKGWQNFISRTMLLLGTALLLCGIIFFFAYNWANLHKFAKLAIVQSTILVFVVITMAKGLDHIVGKCSLLAACVMIGPALGVYGTIYQTGADAYELFLGWSLLMFGWVAISNFGGLWFIWLVLVNVFVTLYGEQVYGYRIFSNGALYLALFAVNFIAMALWEYCYVKKVTWLQNRFFSRSIAIFLHYVLVQPTLIIIFGRGQGVLQIIPVIYALYVAAIFVVYQRQIRDLFMLTINCLSLIVVLSCVFGKNFVNNSESFILLSLFIMAITAMAGYWLNKVGKSWNN
ncbi:DUF2157 domain-containing protein [Candidatus Uabimicrobium amorphum]|uniref:Membrane protein n=1 Tax=Uabimicrobium amorphum TaxID=2596890 RepID=A0A5S9II61_UABAM|nr:DUF2157 domain-containing protein [Candidatus Uabimicrobium amorphum]BBM82104.1 membrane protein [Candidatus Uabimicrobium amorphum]